MPRGTGAGEARETKTPTGLNQSARVIVSSISGRHGCRLRIKISHLAQTAIALFTPRVIDNDGINQFNVQKLPGPNQLARPLDVRVARRRVAGRMIVRDDDGRCTEDSCQPEHLARAQQKCVERPLANKLKARHNEGWYAWRGSNPQPSASEADALSN